VEKIEINRRHNIKICAEKIDPSPFPRMIAQNIPYKMVISTPTDLQYINQRAQVSVGDVVYDICWDTENERILCVDANQSWYEILYNNVKNNRITIFGALTALGCVSDETIPILTFPENEENDIEWYLNTPVSSEFLIQMDVVSRSAIVLEKDDDPSSSSDDNDNIDDSDSEDPTSDE
jgi:hypothetical protein